MYHFEFKPAHITPLVFAANDLYKVPAARKDLDKIEVRAYQGEFYIRLII